MLPKEEEKLDPRVKRTRLGIEQAFTELVTEKGFQTLSVQDITERAGINRATFYAHFADKYTLLDHSIRRGFKQEIEKRTLNACHFSVSNLKNLVIAVCEFVATTHDHCAAADQQYQSLIELQVRTQIQELLMHWLENLPSTEKSSISNERTATAASWAIYGLATEWSHAKRMPPVEQYASEVLPLVTANLSLVLEIA